MCPPFGWVGVVLPACSWADASGTYVNAKGIRQTSDKALAPLGSSLPAWEQIAKTWDDVRMKRRPRVDAGLAPEAVRDLVLAVLGEVRDPGLRASLQDKLVEALAAA